MWSYLHFAVACALLVADSISTSTNIIEANYNIYDRFETGINTDLRPIDTFSCFLQTPTGETIQFRPENHGDPEKYQLREFNILNGCSVTVTITEASDNGLWKLYYTANGTLQREQLYKITVNGVEPPEINEHDDRQIEFLPEESFNTTLGTVHRVTIGSFLFIETESCHLRTPQGVEYILSDELYIPGVQYVRSQEIACGVELSVDSESSVGNWTLFSKDLRTVYPIERRLSFIINVEVNVTASPEDVSITEGNDLYLRLANPASDTNSCKIVGPEGNDNIDYEIDENHKDLCGFIIHNINKSHGGLWAITYGTKINYKALVQVTVNAAWKATEENLEWVENRPVDVMVGPEDVAYCRVIDPTGHRVFEGFGRCHIVLDRVATEHRGQWTAALGLPGNVLTHEHTINVKVNGPERKPTVITEVVKERPEVLLTCALPGEHSLRSCKFQDPSGRTLIATQGVGQDRYIFHGNGVSLKSQVETTSCGLRITDPVVQDLGLWRCAMQTASDEVYYGFLTVLCPWALSDPAVAAAVTTEPRLTATQQEVLAMEGEAVSMSCSVQAEIRYCYFRARNGTVFNISPATKTTDMEYVGAGFEAGECGVRFNGLQETDSGAWSCHVGLTGHNAHELRASYNLRVQRAIAVNQVEDSTGLNIHGSVYGRRSLEYCRFIRIDGLGFTSENLPEGYTNLDSLSTGECNLHVSKPTILDHHPWTVVARIMGHDVEISGSTDHSLTMPDADKPDGPHAGGRYMQLSHAWILMVLLCITIVLLAMSLCNKRARRWTHARASAVRNSFRKEMVPPPPYNSDTAVAA